MADNPLDPFNMLQNLQIPGFDVEQFMRSNQENLEAMQAANAEALAGWQKLAERQAEMFREAAAEWQNSLTNISTDPAEQGERIQQGIQQSLSNLQELNQLAIEAQTNAFTKMQEQFQANMQRIADSMKR